MEKNINGGSELTRRHKNETVWGITLVRLAWEKRPAINNGCDTVEILLKIFLIDKLNCGNDKKSAFHVGKWQISIFLLRIFLYYGFHSSMKVYNELSCLYYDVKYYPRPKHISQPFQAWWMGLLFLYVFSVIVTEARTKVVSPIFLELSPGSYRHWFNDWDDRQCNNHPLIITKGISHSSLSKKWTNK